MLSPKRKAALRRQLLKRDGPNCWLCGTFIPEGDRTLDHAIPQSKGGSDSADNLRLAHERCNVQRGNLEAIKAAKQPAWQERARKAGAALHLPAIVDGRRMAESRNGARGEARPATVPQGNRPTDYRAFIRRKSGSWTQIERTPKSIGDIEISTYRPKGGVA